MLSSDVCVFCQIWRGELPAQTVHTTEHTICFFSHEPIQPGHTLIVPKQHYPDLIDLPDEVAYDVWAASRWLYHRIQAIYQPDGISLMQNNGQFNDTGHYHLHIWPRYQDDGFDWVSPFEQRVTQEWLRKEALKWETKG